MYHFVQDFFLLLSLSNFGHPVLLFPLLVLGKLNDAPVLCFHFFSLHMSPLCLLCFKIFNVSLSGRHLLES